MSLQMHLGSDGIPYHLNSGSEDAVRWILGQAPREDQIATIALAGWGEDDMIDLAGPEELGAFFDELGAASPGDAMSMASRLRLPRTATPGRGMSDGQLAFMRNVRRAAQRVEAVRTTMEAAAAAQANCIVGFNSATLAASFGTCAVSIQPGTGISTGGWVFRAFLVNDAAAQRIGVKNFTFAGLPLQSGVATVTPAPATTGIASMSAFDTRTKENQLLPYIGREFAKDDLITFDAYNHTVATEVNGGTISLCGVVMISVAPCERPQNPVQKIGAGRAVRRATRLFS